jgi:hypothetical protein
VELARTEVLMRTLNDRRLERLAAEADHRLKRVLEHMRPAHARGGAPH